MEAVLSSLAALCVSALPTFFLLLILHFYLKAMFFGPLEKALAERKAATDGTRKSAEESLARAEAKAAEYDAKLRDARGQIYKEQEALRTQLRQELAARADAKKAEVAASIKQARQTVEAELAAAKAGLAPRSAELADQIARALLVGRAR
jgi:F-type H+-transporting ATPase subunit b